MKKLVDPYPHPDYGLWVVMTTIRPKGINITSQTSRSMMMWGVLNNITNHMLIKLKTQNNSLKAAAHFKMLFRPRS